MILGILQARFTSSRLPGKVLLPLLDKPMIIRQIERLRHVRQIDRIVLATSDDTSDDRLAEACVHAGIECFRGNLNDVLDRFYMAAKSHQPDHVVRLTGDCPLADPALIDQLITFYLQGAYDYVSNCLEPTYPDGLDAEVFRFSCLRDAWREAVLPSQREHVTPFIHQQPERYKQGCLKNETDLSWLRWTVDEPVDFELVSRIYEALYPLNPAFTTNDILAYLDKNPDLKTFNTHHGRNEGYIKSLKEDAIQVPQ